MVIAKNSVVSFHYQVATSDGESVDSSQGGEPMVYLHGHSQIVPGLEEALTGRAKGDHLDVTVPPEKGYGQHDPELDMQVPVDVFPAEARTQLKPGFQFMAEHPTKAGENVLFTVHNLVENDVQVSGNHVLAGTTLLFKVDIVDVRAATAEELAHGHAHGPGGHHHH